jgi:hypothetical protein
LLVTKIFEFHQQFNEDKGIFDSPAARFIKCFNESSCWRNQNLLFHYFYPLKLLWSHLQLIMCVLALSRRICGGCNQDIIYGNCLGCMDTYFHPDCFKCHSCRYPITEREVVWSSLWFWHIFFICILHLIQYFICIWLVFSLVLLIQVFFVREASLSQILF